jgi:hypothetical protein
VSLSILLYYFSYGRSFTSHFRLLILSSSPSYLIFHRTCDRRYGPIYFEAFKLEDRDERDASALCVVKKGLKELPRYGPLWFGLLKIIERRDWYVVRASK